MSWVPRIVESIHWDPLSLEIPWDAVEGELHCVLPEDFKELAQTFGAGVFSGFIEIAWTGGVERPLLGEWNSLRQISKVNTFAAEDLQRYGVYQPGGSGLLPWANTYSECQIYWLADSGPPSEWSVIVQDSEGEWSEFKMSASEFIFRVLTEVEFKFSVAEYGSPFYELSSDIEDI
ncbi:SMI1/KNR4 family protein [Streptomyces goshikiensis]|uniref:SMI1/KNR4 family protein n=1 Tax=Streptomyces goshikiensis TaxID=1942 RepID=UPI00371A769C